MGVAPLRPGRGFTAWVCTLAKAMSLKKVLKWPLRPVNCAMLYLVALSAKIWLPIACWVYCQPGLYMPETLSPDQDAPQIAICDHNYFSTPIIYWLVNTIINPSAVFRDWGYTCCQKNKLNNFRAGSCRHCASQLNFNDLSTIMTYQWTFTADVTQLKSRSAVDFPYTDKRIDEGLTWQIRIWLGIIQTKLQSSLKIVLQQL